MFDKTITLFCHNHSDLGDTWFPYLIRGVQINTDKGYLLKSYGADFSDSISIHIPYRKNEAGDMVVDDYLYLSPKAWDAAYNDAKAHLLTFKGGQNFDFIYIGDFNDVGAMEMIRDDDYRNGFYDYFKRNFDDVYAVSSVSGPFSVIPHFELLCK